MQRSVTVTGKFASRLKICAADIRVAEPSAHGGASDPYRRLLRDIRRCLLHS